jgi:hypothetical protein
LVVECLNSEVSLLASSDVELQAYRRAGQYVIEVRHNGVIYKRFFFDNGLD